MSHQHATYNTAVQASHMVDGNITVIDSKSISFGLGYQIKQIVELVLLQSKKI